MNNPGDSMNKFGVPIVGRYTDGDWYSIFDVEYIFYNVRLCNYKDNNKRKPDKLNDILDSSV